VMQRRMALLALAALLIGGVGVAVAATRDPDKQTTASGAPSPGVEADVTTTTVESPTTTVAVTTTSTPPTTRASSTSTTRRVTTTVARVTTTKPPASTTTTKPAAPICAPAQIAASVATDKPSYAPGQQITVTSTLRNKSSDTCFYKGYTFRTGFRDEAGHTFVGVGVVNDSMAEVALRPGEAITHSGPWDHPGTPAGVYTAVATWNFGSATYELTTSLILS
jgi:hypothetical protein